jgi:hypothetical protein
VNFREEFRVELDRGEVFSAGRHFGEAGVEACKEAGDIKPQMVWGVGFEIAVNAFVEFAGTADVAIAKMIEGYGSLDETLIKLSGRPAVFRPEFLPDLMTLVIVALVEFLDSLKIEGLVGGGVHGVALRKRMACMMSGHCVNDE